MQLFGLSGAPDYTQLQWDALAAEIMASKRALWETRDSYDILSGTASSATLSRLLGDNLQGSIQGMLTAPIDPMTGATIRASGSADDPTYPPGTGSASPYGFNGYDLIVNFKDASYIAQDGSTDWMTQLLRGPDNTVLMRRYKISENALRDIAAFIVAAFALYYAITSLGGPLNAPASGLPTESIAADPFANEWAKLLQQQTLAQSGVDLLSTALPTIDVGAASWLSPASWLTPGNVNSALQTVKTATGIATALTAANAAQQRATQIARNTPYASSYLPQYAQQSASAQDNTMLWLGLGAVVVAGLIVRKGKK